ncbi:glutamate 5-kinase [Ectothiorhodospiraceae bacterium BW-2]|nr:glutamate 5-kinase [Ectothiorhodospiraceae bacterium BW-2]
MFNRSQLSQQRRWVIKIGSALLTNDGQGLNQAGIAIWVEQIVALRQQGLEVVLVSSGAVAEGMRRLGLTQRPKALHRLQAAAAVGQMGLVQCYESNFHHYGYHTAQILLTHDDLSNRERYLNARSTLRTLIEMGVVPIVNENDTVVTDEIRFGDNDTLAALVANLIEAELLVILTDQAGMFSADPRQNQEATLIEQTPVNAPELEIMASGSGGALGRGGMLTKVRAARLASRSGSATVIAAGREEDILLKLRRGESTGTLFIPDTEPLAARKQWLLGHLRVKGQVRLDQGAERVLQREGRSLLPVGVTAVEGRFERGDIVACLNLAGEEIARGLINYSSEETAKIAGHSSGDIGSILGYVDEPELIHRDQMVLI